MAGERRDLGCDPFLEVAVRADDERPVVDHEVARPVELGGQAALGDRHPDRVGHPLAKRSSGRLDAGRQAVLGMAGRLRAPLAEPLELLERQVIAGEVEERVEKHRRVPGAQHEAVAIRPIGPGRSMAEKPRPQDVGHRSRTHWGARVARVRLLDGVDRQRPDGVDGELVEPVGGDRHLVSWLRWQAPARCGDRPSQD